MDNWLLILAAVLLVAALTGSLLYLRSRGKREIGEAAPGRYAKTASALGAALRRAWGEGVGDSTWEQMEDALLAADVGVATVTRVVDRVRSARPESPASARAELAEALRSELMDTDRTLRLVGSPSVLVVVGVNGSGKTTTIAKLAARLIGEGKSVVLGAADTFRAAAADQLQAWGQRLGVRVISGKQGADPASVAFDAVSSARAKGVDVVIVDTAGRLHDKKNLMAELAKIHRVAAGEHGVDEVLLVLDATSGQNGISQVNQFTATVPVSGIVLTKLDGTARGGIVIAVEKELGVPVKLVGVGESLDALMPFDPDNFVSSLLEES